MPNLITLSEAAALVDVSTDAIRRAVHQGHLKGYTQPGKGRALFVDRQQAEEWAKPKPITPKGEVTP